MLWCFFGKNYDRLPDGGMVCKYCRVSGCGCGLKRVWVGGLNLPGAGGLLAAGALFSSLVFGDLSEEEGEGDAYCYS